MKTLKIEPQGKGFDSFSKDYLTKLAESGYDFDTMEIWLDRHLCLSIPKDKMLVIKELDMELSLLAMLCNTDKVYNLLDTNNQN